MATAQRRQDPAGFVPLGHVQGEARLGDHWLLGFELDGSAAPQGRAFDIAAMYAVDIAQQ